MGVGDTLRDIGGKLASVTKDPIGVSKDGVISRDQMEGLNKLSEAELDKRIAIMEAEVEHVAVMQKAEQDMMRREQQEAILRAQMEQEHQRAMRGLPPSMVARHCPPVAPPPTAPPTQRRIDKFDAMGIPMGTTTNPSYNRDAKIRYICNLVTRYTDAWTVTLALATISRPNIFKHQLSMTADGIMFYLMVNEFDDDDADLISANLINLYNNKEDALATPGSV